MSTTGDHLRDGPIGQRSTTYAVPRALPDAEIDTQSAVSWGAIFAGAAAAASLSLILLLLGTGLGLSSVSPWSFEGVSAETFGWSTIGWISFTSIAASGLGGYLSGRLRTKWVSVDRDESFFRDTAHGFLSWAVATLLTAALLTSAVGAILGTGVKAGASLAGAAAGTVASVAGGAAAAGASSLDTDDASGAVDYWVDSLFRGSAEPGEPPAATPASTPSDMAMDGGAAGDDTGAADPAPQTAPRSDTASRNAGMDASSRAEVARIFIRNLGADSLDPVDAQYVAQVIAEETGLSPEDAQARVTDIDTRMRTAMDEAETTARQTADEVRKASAYAALWMFITLLMGAFFASLFATFGGRQREA